MQLGLENKIALVVGSSSGLGYATAKQLAQEGARVMLTGHHAQRLQSAVAELQKSVPDAQIEGVVADLAQQDQVKALVEKTVARFGGLDILITNAGGPPKKNFRDIEESELMHAIDTLLLSTMTLIRTALPHLEKSKAPTILTITSVSTKQPLAGLSLSNILRPAVIGLTKTLSKELSHIRVNSILPGWTQTDRTNELLSSASAEKQQAIIESIPLKRFATPEEFANVATFLVSSAASYVNGVMLQVDGGLYHGLL